MKSITKYILESSNASEWLEKLKKVCKEKKTNYYPDFYKNSSNPRFAFSVNGAEQMSVQLAKEDGKIVLNTLDNCNDNDAKEVAKGIDSPFIICWANFTPGNNKFAFYNFDYFPDTDEVKFFRATDEGNIKSKEAVLKEFAPVFKCFNPNSKLG